MIPTQQPGPFLPRDPRTLRMAAYRAVSQGVADTDWRGWGRHSVRRAVAENFVALVAPILTVLQAQTTGAHSNAEAFRLRLAEAEDRAAKHAASATSWERRHSGAVAEARRQEHRAALLAEALGDVLRKFPKRDRTKHAWEDRLIVSHSVYRDDLARWGQLIPDSRRGRDWRRNTVLRTKRDATNRERGAAQSAAYKAREEARNAVEQHRQELKARSEAEIGWREAAAEVKRLTAELGDAPQRIAEERAAADRFAHHADVAFRDRAAEERRHAETKRRYASTIRQAQREHRRAEQLAAEVEQLRAELADYQLAASEQQGAQQRLCGASIGSPLDPSRLIGPCIRPASHTDPEHQAVDGVKWTLLVPELHAQAAPCWCGHDPGAHVTDGADNAVCRTCLHGPQLHQAFHVHAPAKEN